MSGTRGIARKLVLASAAVAVGLVCPCARAAALPTTWTLTGAAFDDGGTATGNFTINVYGFLGAPSSLATTGGSTLAGFAYDLTTPVGSTADSVDFYSASFGRDLHVQFDAPLASGGTIAIDAANSYECLSFSCPGPTGAGGDTRFFLAGADIVPVPEPASLALLGAGLLGLAFSRRSSAQAR